MNVQIHRYKNHNAYQQSQEIGNRNKLDRVWVIADNIAMLSGYLLEHVPNIRFGLCHGTRRGMEQSWFRKCLAVEVVGTEISSTAGQFAHTILWDFHDVKPEWVGAVDFIYSNSLDHSYKPHECIDAWMSCIRPDGVCIVEWSRGAARGGHRFDPFEATEDEYDAMFRAKYVVLDKLPGIGHGGTCVHFVIGHHEA